MPVRAALAAGLACLATAALIVVLRPLLVRYALARPNTRSSHIVPTPQGGGAAVLAACALAVAVVGPGGAELGVLGLAALALALVGAVDDVHPLPPLPRLAVQAAAVGAVVMASDLRLLPAVPAAIERGAAILAGLWFVNLTNFMDGLDWLTVAASVPAAAALVAFGLAGRLPPEATLVAAALLGGMLGFAPFNRPVARLFLGDVGSLPLGLVLAWLLYRLAAEGGLAAALLLPLYSVADATLTLARRAARGARVWQAHREHYYQRAGANGLGAWAVAVRLLALNAALAGLAAATLAWPGLAVAALAAGGGLVALTLRRFARPLAAAA